MNNIGLLKIYQIQFYIIASCTTNVGNFIHFLELIHKIDVK